MPYPMPYFTPKTPFAVKLRNLGLYADDGSVTGKVGTPTGILFQAACRPILLECIYLFPGTVPGNASTRLDAPESGSNFYASMLDTSAIIAGGADLPGQKAQYQFTPVLAGSNGDGTSAAGGWHLLCHFIPMGVNNLQQSMGADMQQNGTSLNIGSRQAPNGNRDNCMFYLDLQLATAGSYFNPAVFDWGGAASPNVPSAGTGVDAFSGETPRFLVIWAGPDNNGWNAPNNTPALPAPYTAWTAATTVGTDASSSVNVNGSTGLADVVNFLDNPPLWRNHVTSGQSISNTTNTKVTLATSGLDNFGGYSASTSTWTVPRDGLYLIHGLVAWSSFNGDTAQRVTGISVNGQIYWGPGYPNAVVGLISGQFPTCNTASTKTQIFSLRAGDTVQLWCRQNSGGSATLSSADESRIFAQWLCAPGIPATLWDPPDTSFRWAAGTPPAQLPGLYQQHFANDLGFLVERPYLMAWQSVTNPGSSGNWVTVNLDAVNGIVHGDSGDNYGGWDPVNFQYVSQRAGWYLSVAEIFTSFPTSPPSSVAAGFSIPTQGGFGPTRTPDVYQHMLAPSANFTPGATAVALSYLLPGETIQLQFLLQDFGFGSTATGTVNGGTVGSHMEICWICE